MLNVWTEEHNYFLWDIALNIGKKRTESVVYSNRTWQLLMTEHGTLETEITADNKSSTGTPYTLNMQS